MNTEKKGRFPIYDQKYAGMSWSYGTVSALWLRYMYEQGIIPYNNHITNPFGFKNMATLVCDDHNYTGPSPCPYCQESEHPALGPNPRGSFGFLYGAEKTRYKDPNLHPASLEVQRVIMKDKAKTDLVNPGMEMVPLELVKRVGAIFQEGLRYGRDNWKKGVGDKEFQQQRYCHALTHLMKWAEGDRTEDHLAKVAWFCSVQMMYEKLEAEEKTKPIQSREEFARLHPLPEGRWELPENVVEIAEATNHPTTPQEKEREETDPTKQLRLTEREWYFLNQGFNMHGFDKPIPKVVAEGYFRTKCYELAEKAYNKSTDVYDLPSDTIKILEDYKII